MREGEDLVAEDEIGRQPLDLRQLGLQAQLALVAEFDIGGELVEVDELQRVGQIDLAEQLIDLRLPIDLLQLLALHVVAQVVQVLEPLRGQQLHLVAERIAGDRAFAAANR